MYSTSQMQEHMHNILTSSLHNSIVLHNQLSVLGSVDNVVTKFYANFKYMHVHEEREEDGENSYSIYMTTSQRVIDIRGSRVWYSFSDVDKQFLWSYFADNAPQNSLLYCLNTRYKYVYNRASKTDKSSMGTFQEWISQQRSIAKGHAIATYMYVYNSCLVCIMLIK